MVGLQNCIAVTPEPYDPLISQTVSSKHSIDSEQYPLTTFLLGLLPAWNVLLVDALFDLLTELV